MHPVIVRDTFHMLTTIRMRETFQGSYSVTRQRHQCRCKSVPAGLVSLSSVDV